MMPPSAPLPLLTEILQRGDQLPYAPAEPSAVVTRITRAQDLPPSLHVLTQPPHAPVQGLSDVELDALAARLADSLQPELRKLLRQALAADPTLLRRD